MSARRRCGPFGSGLKESDRAREMFEGITRGLAEADGVQLGRQRLDSTHVVPNIAILTRLGLFVETVAAFLKELRRELPVAFATVPVGYVKRYLDREGYFSDAKRSQAPRRLVAVAQDVLALHDRFAAHAAVALLPGFVTLRRLLNEQCKLVDVDPNDANGDGGGVWHRQCRGRRRRADGEWAPRPRPAGHHPRRQRGRRRQSADAV
jgi:hypothetical protein